MEKLIRGTRGQWRLVNLLNKGAMKRLAPKPNTNLPADVGGGTGSLYRPIEDSNHLKRAQHRVLKDRLSDNPRNVKVIDGVHHVLLHRGFGDSKYDQAPHVIRDDNSITHRTGHGQYTLERDTAASFGDPESIWAPIASVKNYSNYSWNAALHSKFSPHRFNDDYDDMADMPVRRLDPSVQVPVPKDKRNKVSFTDVAHVLVEPGQYVRATADEVEAAKRPAPTDTAT